MASAPLLAGILQILLVLAALAVAYRPLGDYLARIFTSTRDLRVERGIYRLIGVNPRAEQRWSSYLRSVLTFSALSLLVLYLILRTQQLLPLSLGHGALAPDLAWNTAASFVANTNWQNYAGESTLGTLAQALGLAVQNFLSAAVGLSVAIVLIRGLARQGTDLLGNFWVDVTRAIIRVLLPLSAIFAVVLLLGGVAQNLGDPQTMTGIAGQIQTIPGGTVASQEAIKNLGTNGGGYFNANAAHPLENPSAWTNLVQIFLILLIPTALTRTFGKMVGSTRQGLAVLGAMGTLFLLSLLAVVSAELANLGTALEGKELRLGVIPSSFFAVATTLTSTGAVDSAHSSYSPLAGGVLMLNMMLGEIAPGGVGSGLYGMLIIAILAVFIAGLMVGRTPEYLGKKIGVRQMRLTALYILVSPAIVLLGTALALLLPGTREAMLGSGPHGLSEVLYAFTSAGNNNGSAFGGLSANTPFFNVALGLAMLLGRFLPMIAVLALAGSLAAQTPTPAGPGTLQTQRPLFIGVMVGVALLVSALTFLPALALGPLAEALG
ncbi:potassium-transporting ATPase subunit KdpA [Mycetocola spongiae]|uniref:potassium-transporting ATPase subunit KdpA n=1 Tax=Mycetocola spongiae TaxID=2859226 RepID=UPI001CF3FBC7|nr:potassium-transporting ATPase subunit KdpA [Mycetocola spongiae]